MTRSLTRTVEQLLLVLVCTGCLMSTLPAEARADASEKGGKDRTSALVASILAAYGGEKTLAEVHSVYSKGSIHTFLRDEKGISTRYFKHPRKLRAELFYPHASETRIINGYQGWRGSDTRTMREVTGPPYLAMVYQFKHLDFPFGFLDKGYTITGLGTEQLRGITVEVLQVSDDEGPTMRVYVDASSHLIARVAAVFNFGPVTSELSAEFSDYRDVAGIKVPFSIINYSGKTRLAETTIIEVRFNTEMPETLFRP
jgi:hypothetical protein